MFTALTVTLGVACATFTVAVVVAVVKSVLSVGVNTTSSVWPLPAVNKVPVAVV